MSAPNQATDLLNDLREYVNVQVEIAKIEAVRAASRLAARITIAIVLVLVLTVTFFVLTISAGLWFGQMLNSNALGFLVLGGICLFMLFILYLFREPLLARPIRNRITSMLQKKSGNG